MSIRQKINIVIPMAGNGSRFKNAGYSKPKPFIDVNGMPMIEVVLKNLSIDGANFILIAKKSDLENEKEIARFLEKKYKAQFLCIDKTTEGAACTILFAHRLINNESPLMLANSDQFIDFEIKSFLVDAENRNLDGSILTFPENNNDPKWSYAAVDSDGFVEKVKEKESISNHATVGVYWFKKGKYFVEAAIDMITNNDRTNNEFYTCPAYNYMIKTGYKVGIYDIKNTKMHGLGTPEDLVKFLNNG